jgi:glycosyltransferase involved in cell wall biosynthesis
MKLSIIVPAYNEERLIGRCLESINSALAANSEFGFHSEVIVVDNNSTDRTAELAGRAGARICFEPVNQIARARNAGAAAASGEWLMFVDADSFLNPFLLADILGMIDRGMAVGCGSTMQMEGLPGWARITLWLWNRVSIICRWAAGSLVVCRADAFGDIGGFNEAFYVAEEIDLSRRVKKWAGQRGLKLVILSAHPLHTSARKMRLYSGWEIARQFMRLSLRPLRAPQDKKQLGLWYDGRR